MEGGKEQKSAIYCNYRLKGKRKNESGREGWKEEKAGKMALAVAENIELKSLEAP